MNETYQDLEGVNGVDDVCFLEHSEHCFGNSLKLDGANLEDLLEVDRERLLELMIKRAISDGHYKDIIKFLMSYQPYFDYEDEGSCEQCGNSNYTEKCQIWNS